MKTVLNDHREQSSLMRLITLIIVAGVMLPWAWLSISAGVLIPFSEGAIHVLTLAIGGKFTQKAFEEFFSSTSPTDVVKTVMKELKKEKNK